MGHRGGHGRRTSWRAVFDPATWVRALVVGTIGVVSMALLACAIALVRDTTGHDWYAAGKLTFTEILIEAGFDDRAPTEYRTADDTVLTLSRDDLKFNGEALLARDHLLRTAVNAAELGAWCGFAGALLCLVLIQRLERGRPIRRAAFDAEPMRRPRASERSVPPPVRPEYVALPPATTAPPGASKDRAAVSDACRPAKPGPANGRNREAASGKGDAPASGSPQKGEDAGRADTPVSSVRSGRKRTYGRWI